jgi:sterol desaturase/sphingolipid hydroxylase (fatty acid hydroxylase superfamily)
MKEQVALLYPAILALFGLALLLEIAGGRLSWNRATLKGGLFAVAGVAAHAVVAAPVIALVLGLLFQHVFPGSAEALVDAPFWLVFPLYFVTEEFCHYWVHRWSHEQRWMWKLHRTHHSAERLNTLVLYRYNVFWTLLLPQAWFGAAAVHLGLYQVFIVSNLITFSVNALTHTAYRWDLALRQLPGLEPVFRVLEKCITLPDTHHAHHGLGRLAHGRGNYAVTLFAFDVLLGTARIPHARQERFGLPGRFDWKEELLWPVFRVDPARAAAARGGARSAAAGRSGPG